MAQANTTPPVSASGAPEPLPAALLAQYLDALLAGHPLTPEQKASVDFGLLHAIASPDCFVHDKARQVLERMGVMERWRLARLVDNVAAPARPLVKEKFAPYLVGMLPEDFAGAARREYPAGARLFAGGDEAHEAFMVESGRVLISKNGRTIAHFGRHEFFGNLPFLLPVRRTADAFALELATVRVLTREAYLARFHTYSAHRQAEELQLAQVMIRQLLGGLARYDSTVKVLVDYLFAGQNRAEQAELLGRWIEHFTGQPALGETRLYGLFNLLELLEGELLLLAHLEMAGAAAVERIRQGQGILRGVAACGLLAAPSGLAATAQPPRFARLVNGFAPPPGEAPALYDVVCVADFLWPDRGNRAAVIGPADARLLKERLAAKGWVYFAGAPRSASLQALLAAGFYAGEVAPGLCALSPAGPPDGLPPPGQGAARLEKPSLLRRLSGWWGR